MLGRRSRGPLLLGITSRMSSMGGTRKLHAAQNEWSRRFAPAMMAARIDETIETTPQTAMTLTMAGSPDALQPHGRMLKIRCATVANSSVAARFAECAH